jgi:CheY-like chemotaxis protein
MGGRVWAESALGKGSTFHATVVVRAVPSPAPWLGLAGKRIVVAVPNASVRRSVTDTLRAAGAEVAEAASRAEAERAAARADLVVSDGIPVSRGRGRARHAELRLLPIGDSPRVNGSTVMVTKPVKRRSLLAAACRALGVPLPAEAGTEVAADATLPPPELRILVVEDNEVNRKVASALLTRLGYDADFAVNGRDALEHLAEQPADVVLMDVQMPVMDGLEATRRIRRRRGKQPWVVALTASVTPEDQAACREAGADDYVPKPITLDALRQALVRSTARRSARASAKATKTTAAKRPAKKKAGAGRR